MDYKRYLFSKQNRSTFYRFFIVWMLLGAALFGHTQSTSAERTFSYFCELFAQNYATFEEKGIDWSAWCETYGQNIGPNTTELELYQAMKAMLLPLNDAHITLRATSIDSAFSASRPSRVIKALRSIPGKERKPKMNEVIALTLRKKGFGPLREIGPTYNSERLFTYGDNGRIGYVRFYRSFGGDGWFKGWALKRHMKKIFKSFRSMDAIIMDIRFNIGGNDEFSQQLAGFLVDQPTVGFYKQTRKNGTFGKMVTKYIRPSSKGAFKKPVILLTNDRTVSAADVLALMLSTLPNATLIGEPSNGSYSDLMPAKLPNGWKITLSNQRYFSVDKVNYEGRGTPVDIEVQNTLADIQEQSDSVLKAAFEFLETK